MMIKFITPANLNGAELCNEIETAGIQVNRRTSPMIDGSGDFWLDIAEADKAKATPIVAAHNGTLVAPEQTIADKLASVGLSVTDLREALGL